MCNNFVWEGRKKMTSIAPVNVWTPELIQWDKDLKEKYGNNAHVIPGNGFAPRTNQPKRPWVIDETLPKTRNPMEVMNEKARERALKNAQNKPDSERNIFDYLLLAQNQLEKMKNSTVMYMA